MADTDTEPLPNGTGLSEEDERLKQRPADIDADVREMERRKRVEALMSSKLFREELERVLDQQLHEGSDAPLLQRIREMVGGRLHTGSLRGPTCVLPINDIRGIEGVGYEKGEKILRCKLAAVYRLVDLFGWTQTGVNGQITARLNTATEQVLTTPRGLLPHEVTASSLVKVDMQGVVQDQGTTNFPINVEGFSLHAAVHSSRPDVRCVLHVRSAGALAVSSMKRGLLPLCQEAALLGSLAYHRVPSGILDNEERDKLVRAMGPHAKVLILTSGGAMCCGETLEEAFYQAKNLIHACDVQLKLASLPVDELQLLDEDTRKQMYLSSRAPPSEQAKWRVGGEEFEALMRMLDNAGFRTGYIYRHPLVKNDVPKPKNDVEVPPAVSSLGYLLEEEELYRQGLWKKGQGTKGERTRWLNSPNVYQKVEVLETGTNDPKKITKWVDANNEEWVQDGSPGHSSTPVKIDTLQFVPKNTNPKEFKKLQQQIKENRRADLISAGPQSHILEGVTWDEASKLIGEDAANTHTGDAVVLMGAASKGIIQRGYQHNATVYSAPYARNPFEHVTERDIDEYRRTVQRKQYDTDLSESEAISGAQITSPASAPSETEEESRDEHRVLRIETKQAPVRSQPEVVLSDVDTTDFLHAERTHSDRTRDPNLLSDDEVFLDSPVSQVTSPEPTVSEPIVVVRRAVVQQTVGRGNPTLIQERTEALSSNKRSLHDYSRSSNFENTLEKYKSDDLLYYNFDNSLNKHHDEHSEQPNFDNALKKSNNEDLQHPKCKINLQSRLGEKIGYTDASKNAYDSCKHTYDANVQSRLPGNVSICDVGKKTFITSKSTNDKYDSCKSAFDTVKNPYDRNTGLMSSRSSLCSIPSLEWDNRGKSEYVFRTQSLPRCRARPTNRLYRTQSHGGFINSYMKDPEPFHYHLPRCNSCGATNNSYAWELAKDEKGQKMPSSIYFTIDNIPQKCLEESERVRIKQKEVKVFKVAKLDTEFVESQEFTEDNYLADINSFSSENQTVFEHPIFEAAKTDNAIEIKSAHNNSLESSPRNNENVDTEDEEIININKEAENIYRAECVLIHEDNDTVPEGEYHSFTEEMNFEDDLYDSPVKDLVEKDIRDYSVPINFYCEDYNRKELSPTHSPLKSPKCRENKVVLEPILEESKSSYDDSSNISQNNTDVKDSDLETRENSAVKDDLKKSLFKGNEGANTVVRRENNMGITIELTEKLVVNDEDDIVLGGELQEHGTDAIEMFDSSIRISEMVADENEALQEEASSKELKEIYFSPDDKILIDETDNLSIQEGIKFIENDSVDDQTEKESFQSETNSQIELVTQKLNLPLCDDTKNTVKGVIKEVFMKVETAIQLKFEMSLCGTKITPGMLETEFIHKQDHYFISEEDSDKTTNDIESVPNTVRTAIDIYADVEETEVEQQEIFDSVYENIFEILSTDAIVKEHKETCVSTESRALKKFSMNSNISSVEAKSFDSTVEFEKLEVVSDLLTSIMDKIVIKNVNADVFIPKSEICPKFFEDRKKHATTDKNIEGQSRKAKVEFEEIEIVSDLLANTTDKIELVNTNEDMVTPKLKTCNTVSEDDHDNAMTDRNIGAKSFDSTVEFEKYEVVSDLLVSIMDKINFDIIYGDFVKSQSNNFQIISKDRSCHVITDKNINREHQLPPIASEECAQNNIFSDVITTIVKELNMQSEGETNFHVLESKPDCTFSEDMPLNGACNTKDNINENQNSLRGKIESLDYINVDTDREQKNIELTEPNSQSFEKGAHYQVPKTKDETKTSDFDKFEENILSHGQPVAIASRYHLEDSVVQDPEQLCKESVESDLSKQSTAYKSSHKKTQDIIVPHCEVKKVVLEKGCLKETVIKEVDCLQLPHENVESDLADQKLANKLDIRMTQGVIGKDLSLEVSNDMNCRDLVEETIIMQVDLQPSNDNIESHVNGENPPSYEVSKDINSRDHLEETIIMQIDFQPSRDNIESDATDQNTAKNIGIEKIKDVIRFEELSHAADSVDHLEESIIMHVDVQTYSDSTKSDSVESVTDLVLEDFSIAEIVKDIELNDTLLTDRSESDLHAHKIVEPIIYFIFDQAYFVLAEKEKVMKRGCRKAKRVVTVVDPEDILFTSKDLWFDDFDEVTTNLRRGNDKFEVSDGTFRFDERFSHKTVNEKMNEISETEMGKHDIQLKAEGVILSDIVEPCDKLNIIDKNLKQEIDFAKHSKNKENLSTCPEGTSSDKIKCTILEEIELYTNKLKNLHPKRTVRKTVDALDKTSSGLNDIDNVFKSKTASDTHTEDICLNNIENLSDLSKTATESELTKPIEVESINPLIPDKHSSLGQNITEFTIMCEDNNYFDNTLDEDPDNVLKNIGRVKDEETLCRPEVESVSNDNNFLENKKEARATGIIENENDGSSDGFNFDIYTLKYEIDNIKGNVTIISSIEEESGEAIEIITHDVEDEQDNILGRITYIKGVPKEIDEVSENANTDKSRADNMANSTAADFNTCTLEEQTDTIKIETYNFGVENKTSNLREDVTYEIRTSELQNETYTKFTACVASTQNEKDNVRETCENVKEGIEDERDELEIATGNFEHENVNIEDSVTQDLCTSEITFDSSIEKEPNNLSENTIQNTFIVDKNDTAYKETDDSSELAAQILSNILERNAVVYDDACQMCREEKIKRGADIENFLNETFVLEKTDEISTDFEKSGEDKTEKMNTAFVEDTQYYSRSSSPNRNASVFESCSESPIRNPSDTFVGDDLSVLYEKDDTILGSPFVKRVSVISMSQTEHSGGIKYWISFDESLPVMDRNQEHRRKSRRFEENKIPSFVCIDLQKQKNNNCWNLQTRNTHRESVLLQVNRSDCETHKTISTETECEYFDTYLDTDRNYYQNTKSKDYNSTYATYKSAHRSESQIKFHSDQLQTSLSLSQSELNDEISNQSDTRQEESYATACVSTDYTTCDSSKLETPQKKLLYDTRVEKLDLHTRGYNRQYASWPPFEESLFYRIISKFRLSQSFDPSDLEGMKLDGSL